jgi:hypothetical protein
MSCSGFRVGFLGYAESPHGGGDIVDQEYSPDERVRKHTS